jgi:hypothetical protein
VKEGTKNGMKGQKEKKGTTEGRTRSGVKETGTEEREGKRMNGETEK